MDTRKYLQAGRNALDWCLGKQNPDGSVQMAEDCFDGIYKFPAAMVVMGRGLEGAKLLNWLENTTLTPQGDLTFPERKVIFDWHKNFYLYTNSWIVIGAQRAGFFRLANRAMDYILTYQNPVTGDFLSGFKDTDQSGLHDTTITGNCGLACLFTGRLNAAVHAAEALDRIVSQQEKASPLFYFRSDRDGKLVREFPPEKELWFRIDSRQPGQLYWYLGIAAAMLAQVHTITGQAHYLRAAEEIFEFLFRCQDDLLRSFASGKVGYAAALLHRTTGKPHYKDTAIRLMDWLCCVQKTDGRWTVDQSDLPWFLTYDCTAEFVYWINEIVTILSSPRAG